MNYSYYTWDYKYVCLHMMIRFMDEIQSMVAIQEHCKGLGKTIMQLDLIRPVLAGSHH